MPESPESTAPIAEVHPECRIEAEGGLKYEIFYPKEREALRAADPLEGYEKVGFVGPSETLFKNKMKAVVSDLREPDDLMVLWNSRTGKIYTKPDSLDMGNRGFVQHEAGFRRYHARYFWYCSERIAEVQQDHRQAYEIALATHADALSEPVPTDNPDYDPIDGEAIERIANQWLAGGSRNTMGGDLENGDWFVTTNDNCGVRVPEFGNQLWIGLRASNRAKGDIEGMARRIGHNCRVYVNGAEHYQKGARLYARTGSHTDRWSDGTLILVPINISFG